jgi:hypothetical protein
MSEDEMTLDEMSWRRFLEVKYLDLAAAVSDLIGRH